MTRGDQSYILLFDGVCNLCNRLVNFVIKRDKKEKFKFAALQSESGQALLEKLGLSTHDFDTFVLLRNDDKVFVKSKAGLTVLKELGGGWRMLYAFMIIPTPIRDFVYNRIARTRYQVFGKRDSCMIPGPEVENRFLN